MLVSVVNSCMILYINGNIPGNLLAAVLVLDMEAIFLKADCPYRLYGFTTVQTFIYFERYNDGRTLKSLVSVSSLYTNFYA